MPSAGFEPAIPAIKLLQTYVLDRTAIGLRIFFGIEHNKLTTKNKLQKLEQLGNTGPGPTVYLTQPLLTT
jgi:hypothetical protein